MLKWERGEAGSWIGRADGFEYRTVVDFFDSECAQQKAEFQVRHDARVASIAAANGYVKLEPGQVVVQVEDLTRIVTWFKGDARTVPHADMDTTLNRFAAAIDAAKGETK
jgi:hypothetical protein